MSPFDRPLSRLRGAVDLLTPGPATSRRSSNLRPLRYDIRPRCRASGRLDVGDQIRIRAPRDYAAPQLPRAPAPIPLPGAEHSSVRSLRARRQYGITESVALENAVVLVRSSGRSGKADRTRSRGGRCAWWVGGRVVGVGALIFYSSELHTPGGATGSFQCLLRSPISIWT